MKIIELWDREIPLSVAWRSTDSFREGNPGVYIWYFNQHFIDSVLYVGRSKDVYERIHDEYRVQGGFISKYIDEKMQEKPIYCDKYSDSIIDGSLLAVGKCDCLPRLKVKIIIDVPEADIYELEKSFIHKLNPILNKQLYTCFDGSIACIANT